MNPLKQHNITVTVNQVDIRPNAHVWPNEATHYRFTLQSGNWRLTGFYSQGSAHKNPPKGLDVFHSVILDAICYLNTPDSLEFMAEFGYDDPNEAKHVYDACKDTANTLDQILTEAEIFEISDWFQNNGY